MRYQIEIDGVKVRLLKGGFSDIAPVIVMAPTPRHGITYSKSQADSWMLTLKRHGVEAAAVEVMA